LLLCPKMHADLTYKVELSGIQEPKLEEALKSSSQLLNFSEHSAASMGVLKRRGEADVANFVKILHGLAYYNAKVNYTIDKKADPIEIHFTIETGPEYPLSEFRILAASTASTDTSLPTEGNKLPQSCSQRAEPQFPYQDISLEDLGITLGTPAYAEVIIQAEEKLLQIMAQKGYPQAVIQKRQVIADQQHKDINVNLIVGSGPLAYFGPTKILGNRTVNEEFFYKKIVWREGEEFNLCDLQATQEALEATGLFSSTLISEGDLDPATGNLPIEIQVSEAKHRSIAGGLGYTTQRGPGAMAEWDHRNVRGMGEKVSIRANIWKDTQDGKISYVLPDFKRNHQDLLLLAEVKHEDIEAYTETSFSLSAILARKINKRLKISYGLMYKSIVTSHSDNNGIFHLLKVPLNLRWSTANSLLDPTKGCSLNIKAEPTLQMRAPNFVYCPTTFTGTFYQPLTEDHRFVLAAKGIIGSIVGTSRHAIPPSERYYAGNENTLRGYSYLTVSPLNHHHDPIGGWSIMVLSLEARMRLSEKLGLVGFYEVGNVYASSVPQLNHQQLQSTGIGVRYHTPVGPIRLDVALPLDRRPKVDAPFQIYMSIGQSF